MTGNEEIRAWNIMGVKPVRQAGADGDDKAPQTSDRRR